MEKGDLVHGPIWTRMLPFALPLAFTSMLQQLYNTADVVVAGRFEGDQAMAAIGSNIAVVSLLVALFLGLSIGSNVVAARYMGMGDRRSAAATASLSLCFSLVSGIVVALPCMALADPPWTRWRCLPRSGRARETTSCVTSPACPSSRSSTSRPRSSAP